MGSKKAGARVRVFHSYLQTCSLPLMSMLFTCLGIFVHEVRTLTAPDEEDEDYGRGNQVRQIVHDDRVEDVVPGVLSGGRICMQAPASMSPARASVWQPASQLSGYRMTNIHLRWKGKYCVVRRDSIKGTDERTLNAESTKQSVLLVKQ